jgi:hypothetical protein
MKIRVSSIYQRVNGSFARAVPQPVDGIRRAIGAVHRRLTGMANFREGWRGHLCEGRFADRPARVPTQSVGTSGRLRSEEWN